MSWRKAQLQDLVFFQRGFDITKAEQKPGPYPVISSSGTASHHNEFMVNGPGVIIGRKGSLGTVHFSEGSYWPHDTTLWSKDFRGNDPRFVYYFMHTLGLSNFDVGGANPTLNRNHIHILDVSIPPLSIQLKIASILSIHDDLIAANQRRMQLLEESARLLYREWFVKRRFLGHEIVPVTDGVPEGWERNSIASLCSFLKRGISPQYDDAAKWLVINQKCVRNGRLSMEQSRRQSKEVKPDRLIQLGDILINSTGAGTLGRVALVMKHIPECTVDSHVTIVRPTDKVEQAFFGLALLSLAAVFTEMGKGATNQLELSRSDIGNIDILVPKVKVQKNFHRLAWPLLEQVQQLADTNKLLREARDMLLPKLMSGALDVSRIAVPKEVEA